MQIMQVKHRSHKFISHKILSCYTCTCIQCMKRENAWIKLHKLLERPVLTDLHNYFFTCILMSLYSEYYFPKLPPPLYCIYFSDINQALSACTANEAMPGCTVKNLKEDDIHKDEEFERLLMCNLFHSYICGFPIFKQTSFSTTKG